MVVEQGEDEEEHEGDADGRASHAVDGVGGPAEDGEEEQTHGSQQLRHGLRQRLTAVAQEQQGRHHHRQQQAVRH